MQEHFNCPCCENRNWAKVRSYHFSSQTNRRGSSAQNTSGANFLNIRRQILFNVWFPNTEEVVLTSIYCKTCGFVCYSPRPDEGDLQAKYAYLTRRENIGALHNPTPRALRFDQKREVFLSKVIAKHHEIKSQKVLDVGGGDGRLLKEFLKQGGNCYIVDFNPNPLPNIHRLGNTLEDIPTGVLFDIIICSYVLEHVAEPGQFLRDIRSRLAPNGVAYIIVPFEIWRGIPIKLDPVTHINFFTVSSLKNALLLNGLKPLSIRHDFVPGSYSGKYKRGIWTVASASDVAPGRTDVDSRETRALMHPTTLTKVKRRLENFWLAWILNLPLTINKKINFIRKLK